MVVNTAIPILEIMVDFPIFNLSMRIIVGNLKIAVWEMKASFQEALIVVLPS